MEMKDGQDPEDLKDGKGLAAFSKMVFPMTEEEGQKLLDHMEGHGHILGYIGSKLYRGDLCHGQDKVYWRPYTIYDAVDAAVGWNL